MSQPIYSLFLVRGYREAYYQLGKAEQAQYWDRVMAIMASSNENNLVFCRSRWCNEAYLGWGVSQYAGIQAVQKSSKANEDNAHFRYLDTESYLGTRLENMPHGTPDFPDPIYQLWMIKNLSTDDMESLPAEEQERKWARVGESIKKNGGVVVIVCDANWSNEEFRAFGVTAWPSLEAEQAHYRDLAEIKWNRYMNARTLLGTRME